MLDDISIDALKAALHGLSRRQDAISNNIANVNTPYYTARRVDFEDQLRQAVTDGDVPATATASTSFTTGAAGLNGNNVDLNAETVLSARTQMAYDLAIRATGDRFTLLRTAIRGA
jgi:flagellar basal-body rod protein FlgB